VAVVLTLLAALGALRRAWWVWALGLGALAVVGTRAYVGRCQRERAAEAAAVAAARAETARLRDSLRYAPLAAAAARAETVYVARRDTLTRVLTRYETLRDTVALGDTAAVSATLAAADAAVRACRMTEAAADSALAACGAARAEAERQRVEVWQKHQALLAQLVGYERAARRRLTGEAEALYEPDGREWSGRVRGVLRVGGPVALTGEVAQRVVRDVPPELRVGVRVRF
jgi:hypothetical protein